MLSKMMNEIFVVNQEGQSRVDGQGAKLIVEDSFLTWVALMSKNDIKENKQLAQRIEHFTGQKYRHWELSRWVNKNRSVPKNAYYMVLCDLAYWILTQGEIMEDKNEPLAQTVMTLMKNREETK
jgi:hypothetical protein